MYKSGSGRSRLEKLVAGQQPEAVQRAFIHYTELLKYWHDDAAHEADVEIDEEEAFTALVLVMRFARFVEDRWPGLAVDAPTP
ncbi:MAG: hypothetical protein V4617_07715 [Gemmatimonadota bacterium]